VNVGTSAPGQAGAIQPVKVRPRQGRSGPPGSECCAAVGDGGREAYTAVVWGVGMSLERHNIVGAETVGSVEGNMCGTVTPASTDFITATPAFKLSVHTTMNVPGYGVTSYPAKVVDGKILVAFV
jgi:hypothetical protein